MGEFPDVLVGEAFGIDAGGGGVRGEGGAAVDEFDGADDDAATEGAFGTGGGFEVGEGFGEGGVFLRGVEIDAAADFGGERADFEAFFPLKDEIAPRLLDAEGGAITVAFGVGFVH